MSVRTAELVMAIALALLSIAFMVKSLDGLSIWWVPEKGPGSGVWPFWLSFLMLLSCLTIIYRWYTRATPQSRSDEPFMDRHAVQVLGTTVAALFLLILLTGIIGIYFSLFLFLFFYLKILGRHSWTLSLALTAAVPVGVFVLFEYALTIPLPKGYLEPLFFPLYKIMYSRGAGIWTYLVPMLLAALTIAAPHYVRLGPADSRRTPIEPEVVYALGTAALFLLFVAGLGRLGAYASLLVFALVYLKVLARQTWLISGAGVVAVLVVAYLVFELALGVTLPKGTWFESLFAVS
jgi:hypothetical protein